ncbi:MAG: nitrous oxide reductase accessory protein NosL [Arcobacteraceae bacterium]|nr:nitrous oxide reductase accessory protein NosL [Arcobacteraceae bacterium]
MFIKKIFLYLTIALIFSLNLDAKSFNKAATVEPVLIQDGKEKLWCPVCGMSIKMFYKTSHASKLQNGTKRQYCSMRCLAVDMQEYGIDTGAIVVVDAKTQKLINAKDAFYVVGSKISGTMSKVSKLAFKKESDAKEFIKNNKGKVVNFDTALKMAQKSLKSDIAMVKKKKKKKVYPKGKRIFEKMCKQDIDPTNYIEINELKSALKNDQLCKPLKEKQLQATALYLWEVKRLGDLGEVEGKVVVNEDEKCPVCGMFTYKYPRWAAQIFYKHNDHEHHWSFDGVKDLMKFYFNSSKWGNYPIAKRENITKILVTDYYSQKGIDGTKAFYVIRSDVYGPMGHELIPFETEGDAETFKADHRGRSIIKFEDIVEEEVYKLDVDE